MGANVGQTLALGQIGANALALPQQIQNQQLAAASDREILRQFGVPEEQLAAMAPEPALKLPGGPVGSVLRGIGGVGSVLSGLLGSPVPAPRPNLGALISARQLQSLQDKRKAQEEAAQLAMNPEAHTDELAAALFRMDEPNAALSVMGLKQGAPTMNASFQADVENATGEAFNMRNPTHRMMYQQLNEEWLQRQSLARQAGVLGAKGDPTLAGPVAQRAAEAAGLKESVLNAPDLARQRGEAQAITGTAVESAKDYHKRLRAVRPMMAAIAETEKAVNNILKSDSFFGRLGQRARFALATQSPEAFKQMYGDVDPAFFEDMRLIEGFGAQLSGIARTIGREVGVLSNQDIARFEPYMPKLTDAHKVAMAKIKVLKKLVKAVSQPDATEALIQQRIDEELLPEMAALEARTQKEGQREAEEPPPAAPAPAIDPALEELQKSLPPGSRILSVE